MDKAGIIAQIIKAEGLKGPDAEARKRSLDNKDLNELEQLLNNALSNSKTYKADGTESNFSFLGDNNWADMTGVGFDGNVWGNNIASSENEQLLPEIPKEGEKKYSLVQQKRLDEFLAQFLYNSAAEGLNEITAYNQGVGWLNITDRVVNGFKVLTGQEDRFSLQEKMKKEQQDANELRDTASAQPGAFEAKIERKYGVPYSHENVEKLKKASEEFTRVSAYHDKFEKLKKGFSDVKNILRQEKEYEQARKYVRGAAAASLTPPSPSSHEKFGEVLLDFCEDDRNMLTQYMDSLCKKYTSRSEIEENLPKIMDELQKKMEAEYKKELNGKSFEKYEAEFNKACEKVLGKKDAKTIAKNFVANAKTQAAFTEIGIVIATTILLPGSSVVKGAVRKAAVKSGERAAAQGFKAGMTAGAASTPAILSGLNAATSKDGFTPEKIEEIKEKFKNGLIYGGFGAYVSGPLGLAVEKVLSKNPSLISGIVSKTMGAATETSADVLFDRMTTDLSFTESLKQNGIMNFGMMFAGGQVNRGLNKLSISKAENNTYIVKDETGKEVFKADDENALAGYILAKGAEKESQVKTPEKIFSEKAPVKNQTLPPFEAAKTSLLNKLQKKNNIFNIREELTAIKNTLEKQPGCTYKLQDGMIEFYDGESATRYKIKFTTGGEITAYCVCKHTETEYSKSFFIYDKNGKSTETDLSDFMSAFWGTRIKNSLYFMSKPEIPDEIAKIMLNHDYAFSKENIDEMLSLVKNKEDWAIVKKLLETKGSPVLWKRTLGKILDCSIHKFTADDILQVLKSEDAKNYVSSCIQKNKYCNKEKIKELVGLKTVTKQEVSQTKDLTYETRDIVLNNVDNVVNEYKANPGVKETIDSQIPLGEVGNINGKLYCRVDGELVPVNLSKETFEQLFPVSERYNIQQGHLDDCWLVSDIAGLMNTPNGRAAIYSLFREEGGNIFVKLPDSNIEVCFNQDNWKKLNTKGVKASDGIKMLEQTVGFNRSKYSDKPVTINADNKTQISEALRSLDQGPLGHGVSFLCNDKAKPLMHYNISENSKHKTEAESLRDLDILLSEMDDFIKSNENAICPVDFNKEFRIDGYKITANHICRITGYDKVNKTVQIVNPHNANQSAEIPLELFLHCADKMNVFGIGKNTEDIIEYNFSVKKLDQSNTL